MRQVTKVLLPVIAAALVSGALPAAAGPAEPQCATVKATLSEYKIKLSKKTVADHCVRFKVINRGVEDHEVIVVEGGKPKAIPNHDGVVDEDEIDVLAETGDLKTLKRKAMTVDMAPGKYVLFCNVLHNSGDSGDEEEESNGHGHGDEELKSESHFGEGMRVVFTVKRPPSVTTTS